MAKDRKQGDWHVTPDLLRAMELGEVDPGVCLTLLMEHLARLCPECSDGVQGLTHGAHCAGTVEATGEGTLHGTDAGEPCDELTEFFESATRCAVEYDELEVLAERELSTLRSVPSHAERLAVVTSGAAGAANPALVELLLEEARSWVHDSPAEARELAELAEAVAVRLPVETYGQSFCRDRITEARAHRANAVRAQGELVEAESLLRQVEASCHYTFDPFLLAEIASFSASLAKDQRRFDEALARLEEAERLFRELEVDFGTLARIHLQRASILSLCGDPAAAIDLILPVIDRLDDGDESELRFIARHNLVSYLCEAERYEEARDLLVELAPAYARHPRRTFRIRFHWRQGRIAHGLGEVAAAERDYVLARDGFLSAGLGYLAALVALDLAILYLEQGRTAEVREIALWTSTLFEVQDVHREALAALALFRHAALEDALTVAQLRQLTRHVATLRTGSAAEPVS